MTKSTETPDTASATATTNKLKGKSRPEMLAYLGIQCAALDVLVERGDVTEHKDGSFTTSL